MVHRKRVHAQPQKLASQFRVRRSVETKRPVDRVAVRHEFLVVHVKTYDSIARAHLRVFATRAENLRGWFVRAPAIVRLVRRRQARKVCHELAQRVFHLLPFLNLRLLLVHLAILHRAKQAPALSGLTHTRKPRGIFELNF